MEFRVLGPIEVYSGDNQVHVGGVKQRSILALLIANHSRVVSADRIIDEIYGDDAAAGARRSVQTIISMLRRDLGDVVGGTGDGYRFDARRESVDVCRFEDLVAAGLDAPGDNPNQASSLLGEALDLWRGDPYGDVDGRSVFQTEIARLTELRFTALEARIEADLACGRHREVVPELEALIAEHPLRERLWAALMLALYRVGRQADALSTYQHLRTVLGEELGLEPSTELRTLEEQILLQDPDLDLVIPIPHNLPAQLTSFIGRQLELIELGERLAETRLVTLTGAGGSGKTRLAIEHGRDVLDNHPDGVWFVDFRATEADGAATLIASTLGVVASGDQPTADHLADALSPRHLLLVLDNCEHILDAVAPIVDRLMSRDGQARVLATSREPLGVLGESMLPVHPLPVPGGTNLNELAESEAVALFADRALSAHPDFALEEHVDSVVEICRTVEGLPLALELAAARLVVFSPEELADRLDNQLATLRATRKAGDLRHATIEATIQWSWDLLTDDERVLLSRLSVFRGTWSLEAAEAICGFGSIDRGHVANLTGGLVDKSLVVVDGVSGSATRYRLLEPIRQYAARNLDDQATKRFRSRLVDYWTTTLALASNPAVPISLRDHKTAWKLEADEPNLTAAVEWALDSERYDDVIVMLAAPFGDLLVLQGSAFETASAWMDAALAHRETISPGALVWALENVCVICNTSWRNEACVKYAEVAIEVARTEEERYWFELSRAVATSRMGQHDRAAQMFDRIVTQSSDPGMQASALLAKSEDEPSREAWALCKAALELSPLDAFTWWDEGVAAWLIGEGAIGSGRYDMAMDMQARSLDLSRRDGWDVMHAHAASRLSWLYTLVGRISEAAALIAEAVSVAQRILGPNITIGVALLRAAYTSRLSGDLDTARKRVAEAASMMERNKTQYVGMTSVIHQSSLIARDDGAYEEARELLDDLPRRLAAMGAGFDTADQLQISNACASIELRRGDPDRALADLEPVLIAPFTSVHVVALESVDLAAVALAQQGQAEQAARLLGFVDRERDLCSLVLQAPDIPVREAAVLHTKSILGDDWDSTMERGRTMTLDDAIEYAAAATSGSDTVAVNDHADDLATT